MRNYILEQCINDKTLSRYLWNWTNDGVSG